MTLSYTFNTLLFLSSFSGKATVQRKARQIEEDFTDEDYDIPGIRHYKPLLSMSTI